MYFNLQVTFQLLLQKSNCEVKFLTLTHPFLLWYGVGYTVNEAYSVIQMYHTVVIIFFKFFIVLWLDVDSLKHKLSKSTNSGCIMIGFVKLAEHGFDVLFRTALQSVVKS